MIYEIEIKGQPPSKKNSRNLFVRNGKMMNIPSKRYSEWHKYAMHQLNANKGLFVGNDRTIERISLEFYVIDKRRRDLTNIAESVMDCLVDATIIADDCWQVVPCVFLKFAGVDKQNPRTIINIHFKTGE